VFRDNENMKIKYILYLNNDIKRNAHKL
jgi:hypothetical protein